MTSECFFNVAQFEFRKLKVGSVLIKNIIQQFINLNDRISIILYSQVNLNGLIPNNHYNSKYKLNIRHIVNHSAEV